LRLILVVAVKPALVLPKGIIYVSYNFAWRTHAMRPPRLLVC
jgi:hypothetical protein